MNILNLPEELLYEIFSYLHQEDLIWKVAFTCTTFLDVVLEKIHILEIDARKDQYVFAKAQKLLQLRNLSTSIQHLIVSRESDDKKSDDTKNDGSNEVSDGCGLGDDEGTRNAEATTKDLESEDIFDTAQKPGEEQNSNEDPQKETKEEDGVEMSEGLENEEMQNIEENAADNSDDNDSSQSDEDEQMDVEEGKTDEGNELLDEDVWNDMAKLMITITILKTRTIKKRTITKITRLKTKKE